MAYCLLAGVMLLFVWHGVIGVRDLRFVRAIDVARQGEVLFHQARSLSNGLRRAAAGNVPDDLRGRLVDMQLRLGVVTFSVDDLERLGVVTSSIRRHLQRLRSRVDAVPLPVAEQAPGELRAVADRIRHASDYFGGDVQQDLHRAMAKQTQALRRYATSAGVLSIIVVVGAGLVLLLVFQLRAKNAALRRLATEDPLTGLPNRRRAMDSGAALVSMASRSGGPVSVAVLDLDYFKQINDRYGHPVGDRVIRAAARCLAGRVRASDLLARVGGEEFMIVLPDTAAQGARAACGTLMEALRTLRVSHGDETIGVTASVGLATGRGGGLTLDDLYKCADAAMYEAKQRGRDGMECVVVHGAADVNSA
ncbi:MAG TPA: GGDEF domain-containing protein [Gammaproteobacteria bacterium]|nr:GGDEF domain-containing protein [Gammaproteobacteria bacterium]